MHSLSSNSTPCDHLYWWGTKNHCINICIFRSGSVSDSMKRGSFWESDSSTANQKIPHLLRNLKIHNRVKKRWPLVLILSHLNPVHVFKSCFFNIHFNIILLSTTLFPPCQVVSSLQYFRLKFDINSHLSHSCYISAHLILLHLITLITCEEYKLWSFSLSTVLQHPPFLIPYVQILSPALLSSICVLPTGERALL